MAWGYYLYQRKHNHIFQPVKVLQFPVFGCRWIIIWLLLTIICIFFSFLTASCWRQLLRAISGDLSFKLFKWFVLCLTGWIYVLEMALKVYSFGFQNYWRDGQNRFDFLVTWIIGNLYGQSHTMFKTLMMNEVP